MSFANVSLFGFWSMRSRRTETFSPCVQISNFIWSRGFVSESIDKPSCVNRYAKAFKAISFWVGISLTGDNGHLTWCNVQQDRQVSSSLVGCLTHQALCHNKEEFSLKQKEVLWPNSYRARL